MKVAVASVLAGAVLLAAGAALARTPSQGALIDTTVRFLQESQGADGGLVGPGGKASQGVDAWGAIALAAAGINPLDQRRCGVDLFTYLEGHFQAGLEEEPAWPAVATTTLERELLVVDAAGSDPHGFAGHDLAAEILARQLPDGAFPHVPGGVEGANDTIFAILALAPVHEPGVEAAIATAREAVVGFENEDGGWYFAGRTGTSEVDMTGAALEALVAAGAPTEEAARLAYEGAERRGLEYLRAAQAPDGGFPMFPKNELESNVASTAWAVQGIWATGGNPEDWRYGGSGPEPLDYMESMQQPDGHIRWRASSDMNGIWMTAYVLPAFAGQALPVPPAARGSSVATSGEAADCLEAGQDGESPTPGPGVIAGGGGHRSHAFGRPRRGSKGKTPGGARVVRGEGLRARDHSPRNRRGANLRQPGGTETEEPRSGAETDQGASVVADPEATTATTGKATPSAIEATATATAGDGEASTGGDDGASIERSQKRSNSAPSTGERHAEGVGSGSRGAALPTPNPTRRDATTMGEEVSGTVIGAPAGAAEGELAFGAPGLKSAGAGSGTGPGLAIGIGAAAALAALLGAGLEGRRRRIA